MKPLMGTILTLAAIAALLAGCDFATTSYASRVIDAGDGTVTIEDPKTAAVTTHEVAADAEVTRDGEPAALEDLQPGDAVSVKTDEVAGAEVATAVHAQSTPEEELPAPQQPLDSEDAEPPAAPPQIPTQEVPLDTEPAPEEARETEDASGIEQQPEIPAAPE